jgi:hypothetical protein
METNTHPVLNDNWLTDERMPASFGPLRPATARWAAPDYLELSSPWPAATCCSSSSPVAAVRHHTRLTLGYAP